jgi:hypothetical protein
VPPLLLRAVWKACVAVQYSGDSLSDFVNAEIVPVARCFFESGDYRQNDIRRLKAGWVALKRRYFPLSAKDTRLPVVGEFVSPIRRVECGGYQFEALESEVALIAEGEAMQHCIGTYGPRLAREMLIVFSVKERKTGQRVATMTVTEVGCGRWDVDEIYGPENRDASIAVLQAAQAVVRLLEETCARVATVRAGVESMRQRVNLVEADERRRAGACHGIDREMVDGRMCERSQRI